jgi:hypothetical protein
LAYSWTFDFLEHFVDSDGREVEWESANVRRVIAPSMVIHPKPVVSQMVSFPAVKADLITDKLTIKIVSVDGVAAETAGRDGHIMIATKAQYNLSPHGIAARQANLYVGLEKEFSFENGTITKYIGRNRDVIIPPTFYHGEPVTAIGRNAFVGGFDKPFDLDSITIPANVSINGAFGRIDYPIQQFPREYERNNKKAGTYSRANGWGYTGN